MKQDANEDWSESLIKQTFNADKLELIAFGHPSKEGTGNMASGYVFKNHTKKYEFENVDIDHFKSNLLTAYSLKDTNEIIRIFGMYL